LLIVVGQHGEGAGSSEESSHGQFKHSFRCGRTVNKKKQNNDCFERKVRKNQDGDKLDCNNRYLLMYKGGLGGGMTVVARPSVVIGDMVDRC